jgi:trimeric autotransporter adhesin
MKSIKLKRPTPGTVLGLLALIVAVAGNANAFSATHVIVRKGDIAKGAVTAKALAAGAVHARAMAPGAVQAKALAKGSVSTGALRSGAVGADALAPDSVTAAAIAPGSVYGAALGPVELHSTPIVDLDVPPELSNWTNSNTEIARCATGERLLSGGIVFTDLGNRRVGIVESLPIHNSNQNGWAGQITSDANGAATAEVQALCLK